MNRLLFLLLLLCSSALAADPIQVLPQGTVTISCTGTTGATALARPDQFNRRQVELSNGGTVPIFVEFGSSTVASVAASGYPVLANQTKTVTVPPSTTHIACITGGTTATLYASAGIGE
jgi:hypothetical protein